MKIRQLLELAPITPDKFTPQKSTSTWVPSFNAKVKMMGSDPSEAEQEQFKKWAKKTLSKIKDSNERLLFARTVERASKFWGKTISISKKKKDFKAIGSGAFGTAYSKKSEPGTVRKAVSGYGGLKADPYYQFVKTISKNQRFSNNPFLPKIFDVNVTGEGDGDQYEVDMERLHPFNTLSDEESFNIGMDLFSNFRQILQDERKEAQEDDRSVDDESIEGKYHHANDALATAFYNAVGSKFQLVNITNSHLKQALRLINSLLKSGRNIHGVGNNDLHSGNIMVRRGRHAPQIVITDPLA